MKALVTGASSGIGKALCFLLASKNISLIITARNEQTLKELASKLPVGTFIHVADLRDKESRRSLIALIQDQSPDLIINSAGIGLYGDILSHSFEEQMNILEVNAHAAIEISIAAADNWIKKGQKGTVMNIASAAAFFAYPTFTLYAASKSCLRLFSQGFDEEVKDKGVRILTSCPGPVATAFQNKASKGVVQAREQALSAHKAAELIWEQIESGKQCVVIDWRIRILISLARLIPFSLLAKFLSKRYSLPRK